MSDQEQEKEVARLSQLNEELKRSLQRCRNMLRDYEVRLTANSNHRITSAEQQESREG